MPITSTDHGWTLETDTTGYALGFNSAGLLTHRYWGARLASPGDYPAPFVPESWASFNNPAQRTVEEYPGYEDAKYVEPCILPLFHDGVRGSVLRFAGAEVLEGDTPELHLLLRDTAYPLEVTLHYRLHERYDLIERWASIRNQGSEPITLNRAWSAQWHVPQGSHYTMTSLAGRWLDETHLCRVPLEAGTRVVESRRLTTSHQHNPWFALDRGGAGEEYGEVWFGALAWSGNWKIAAEVTDFASTRVSIGINDWDFAWRLNGGEEFTTPASIAGYSNAGFGTASRRLHDYVRDTLLPHGKALHKVLYNSWEATFFNVDEASQTALAEVAAGLGIELFVLDDGWFHGRKDDFAGLGDWWPDEAKFPNGLSPLIQRVNDLGMEFGLWIEPEMVNPNSDLYRAHPDWIIHFPTRERTLARSQHILNMGRTDVQDYLIEKLDTLLSENNIAFIKWDMNRNVSEPGWPDAPGEQREIWVRYVYGLYRLWGTLRERHPNVIWQSCSGGGGRADLAMLRLADQIWTSDNTEPTARLNIQEGFSQVYPANTMEAWVTEMGPKHLPLEFRFHVSMCGSLGVGSHLLHWNEDERELAARCIATYKQIRHIVQLGDMFRLRSPQAGPFSAVLYATKDKREAVLFAFRTHMPVPAQVPPLALFGLDPQGIYTVEGIAGEYSGAHWMQHGVQLELGDFQSTVRQIRRVG